MEQRGKRVNGLPHRRQTLLRGLGDATLGEFAVNFVYEASLSQNYMEVTFGPFLTKNCNYYQSGLIQMV